MRQIAFHLIIGDKASLKSCISKIAIQKSGHIEITIDKNATDKFCLFEKSFLEIAINKDAKREIALFEFRISKAHLCKSRIKNP